MYLGIYVDDGILLGSDENEMNSLLDDLKKVFEIVVNKNPKNYAGFEMVTKDRDIYLTQQKYIKTFLEKYNMEDSKGIHLLYHKIVTKYKYVIKITQVKYFLIEKL